MQFITWCIVRVINQESGVGDRSRRRDQSLLNHRQVDLHAPPLLLPATTFYDFNLRCRRRRVSFCCCILIICHRFFAVLMQMNLSSPPTHTYCLTHKLALYIWVSSTCTTNMETYSFIHLPFLNMYRPMSYILFLFFRNNNFFK